MGALQWHTFLTALQNKWLFSVAHKICNTRLREVLLLVRCHIWLKLMARKRKLGQQSWNGSWGPDGIQCGLPLIRSNLTPLSRGRSRVERHLKQKPTLKPLPYVTDLE